MKKRFLTLLLILALLLAACGAPSVSSSLPTEPPASPAPVPEVSSQPQVPEPESGAEPERPLKTPEDYTPEELDFIEKFCQDYNLPPENFWKYPDTQESIEREYRLVNSWLALPPEQLAERCYETVAFSNDLTKAVYLMLDTEDGLSISSYYIWSDHLTGENRLLCILTAWDYGKNPEEDVLIFYNHGRMRGFSLQTGEELEDCGPPFDFGEETLGGWERELFGLAWDEGTGCAVAAYLDRTRPNEDGIDFPICLAVFDRDGVLIRDFSTWFSIYDSYKNFPTYAEVLSFSKPGTLRLGCLHHEGALRIDYLTAPVPLEEPEVLALWDTLEGKWAVPTHQIYGEDKKEAAFFLREGRPVLTLDGQEYSAGAVSRWADTVWEITAQGGDGEKQIYVDTGIPGDYTIQVMEEGEWDYSFCIYAGEAGSAGDLS